MNSFSSRVGVAIFPQPSPFGRGLRYSASQCPSLIQCQKSSSTRRTDILIMSLAKAKIEAELVENSFQIFHGHPRGVFLTAAAAIRSLAVPAGILIKRDS